VKISSTSLLAFALLASSVESAGKSADQPDPWSVLNKITHRRIYRIETRDGKCVRGRIIEATADHLRAEVYAPNSHSPNPTTTAIFSRAKVLSVAGWYVYYSGRSSWLDVRYLSLVRRMRERGRERLKVVTKTGKVYQLKPPYDVSDEEITVGDSRKPTELSKSEIALVYHIVPKPLTDSGEYAWQELGPLIVFDPDLWVYGLHLEQYVQVLLYNAADPEDDSPAECLR
jgi:hypothetical protein